MTYTDDRVDSGLTDRVSLLQNAMHKLGADVIRLQTQLSEIATAAPPRSQERAPASQFIFNLSRDEYRGELAALVSWVNDFLIPVYAGPVTRWCPAWWEHHEAVGRLHALRLSYLELTDTTISGIGAGIWHRDHLDPVLTGFADGPFVNCWAPPVTVERLLTSGSTDPADPVFLEEDQGRARRVGMMFSAVDLVDGVPGVHREFFGFFLSGRRRVEVGARVLERGAAQFKTGSDDRMCSAVVHVGRSRRVGHASPGGGG